MLISLFLVIFSFLLYLDRLFIFWGLPIFLYRIFFILKDSKEIEVLLGRFIVDYFGLMIVLITIWVFFFCYFCFENFVSFFFMWVMFFFLVFSFFVDRVFLFYIIFEFVFLLIFMYLLS